VYRYAVKRHRAFPFVLLAATLFASGGWRHGGQSSWLEPSAFAETVRWAPGAGIRVWIDPAGMPSGADALVAMAMKTWTDAALGRLKLLKVSAAADVQVHFVQSDGVFGETAPRVDPRTGEIVAAEIVITAATSGDTLDGRIVIYLTALHEIGHALGLAHTDAFDSIMHRFQRPDDAERYFGSCRARLRSAADIGTERATGLSSEDVRALRALYDR
jgi:hypothetical protein